MERYRCDPQVLKACKIRKLYGCDGYYLGAGCRCANDNQSIMAETEYQELQAYRATGLTVERAAELGKADREGRVIILQYSVKPLVCGLRRATTFGRRTAPKVPEQMAYLSILRGDKTVDNDLISRKALLDEFDRVCVKRVMAHGASVNLEIDFVRAVQQASAVDPHEHGRWIMRGGKLHCSNCEDLAPLKRGWEDGCTTYEYTASRYCPNCGVKIDGSENGVVDEVPPEFVAHTLEGKEITGETRDKLYRVMDKSIDKFLESEVGGEK